MEQACSVLVPTDLPFRGVWGRENTNMLGEKCKFHFNESVPTDLSFKEVWRLGRTSQFSLTFLLGGSGVRENISIPIDLSFRGV